MAALPGAQAAVGVVQKGLRPVIPSSCPAGLASVMRDCWQRDPRERPSFEQLKVQAWPPACASSFGHTVTTVAGAFRTR